MATPVLKKAATMAPPPPKEEMDNEPVMGKLSAEDKVILKEAVSQGISILYEKKMFEKALGVIKASANANPPFLGVSKVVVWAMVTLKKASIEQKVDLTDDIMLYVAHALVRDMVNAAIRARIFTKDFPKGFVDGAFIRTVDEYRRELQKLGLLDEEKYKRVWSRLQESEKEGTLLAQLGLNRQKRRAMGIKNAKR